MIAVRNHPHHHSQRRNPSITTTQSQGRQVAGPPQHIVRSNVSVDAYRTKFVTVSGVSMMVTMAEGKKFLKVACKPANAYTGFAGSVSDFHQYVESYGCEIPVDMFDRLETRKWILNVSVPYGNFNLQEMDVVMRSGIDMNFEFGTPSVIVNFKMDQYFFIGIHLLTYPSAEFVDSVTKSTMRNNDESTIFEWRTHLPWVATLFTAEDNTYQRKMLRLQIVTMANQWVSNLTSHPSAMRQRLEVAAGQESTHPVRDGLLASVRRNGAMAALVNADPTPSAAEQLERAQAQAAADKKRLLELEQENASLKRARLEEDAAFNDAAESLDLVDIDFSAAVNYETPPRIHDNHAAPLLLGKTSKSKDDGRRLLHGTFIEQGAVRNINDSVRRRVLQAAEETKAKRAAAANEQEQEQEQEQAAEAETGAPLITADEITFPLHLGVKYFSVVEDMTVSRIAFKIGVNSTEYRLFVNEVGFSGNTKYLKEVRANHTIRPTDGNGLPVLMPWPKWSKPEHTADSPRYPFDSASCSSSEFAWAQPENQA
jgi:hypothetical protein